MKVLDQTASGHIKNLRVAGKTWNEIATKLREEGYQTPRKAKITPTFLMQLSKKAKGNPVVKFSSNDVADYVWSTLAPEVKFNLIASFIKSKH